MKSRDKEPDSEDTDETYEVYEPKKSKRVVKKMKKTWGGAGDSRKKSYGDTYNDISYLFAEWDAYPAEQEGGVGMYERSSPKRFCVTASPIP